MHCGVQNQFVHLPRVLTLRALPPCALCADAPRPPRSSSCTRTRDTGAAYLNYVGLLNQAVMMSTQLYNDATNPAHHKYAAHQVALLYVSLYTRMPPAGIARGEKLVCAGVARAVVGKHTCVFVGRARFQLTTADCQSSLLTPVMCVTTQRQSHMGVAWRTTSSPPPVFILPCSLRLSAPAYHSNRSTCCRATPSPSGGTLRRALTRSRASLRAHSPSSGLSSAAGE